MRVAIALLFLGITAAYSQTQSVERHKAVVFSGNVTDITGASIPKTTISLEDKEHSILWTIADQTGHFAMEARPGEYTLRAISPGFTTYKLSISFADSTSIKKDLVLQVSPDAGGYQGPCCFNQPPIELLNVSLISTLPLHPLLPLKLHKRIAR